MIIMRVPLGVLRCVDVGVKFRNWVRWCRCESIEAPHGIGIKLSKYQSTGYRLPTGWFIGNVIPGYRPRLIHPSNYLYGDFNYLFPNITSSFSVVSKTILVS